MRTDTARCVNSVLSVLTKKSELTDYVWLQLMTTENAHIFHREIINVHKKFEYTVATTNIKRIQAADERHNSIGYSTIQYPQIQMDVAVSLSLCLARTQSVCSTEKPNLFHFFPSEKKKWKRSSVLIAVCS